jgi:hypothetical protein
MHSINRSPVKRQRPQWLLIRMLRVLHSSQRITRRPDLRRSNGFTESEEHKASRLTLAEPAVTYATPEQRKAPPGG